jgi:hypothetical protein
MKRAAVAVLKLAVVVGLFWFVFRQIPFVDRLVERRGEVVVVEREVDIVGSWQATPLRYRVPGEAAVLEARLGAQADGSSLSVAPGFLTYWRNLDPLLFAAGALCYFLTALIAGTTNEQTTMGRKTLTDSDLAALSAPDDEDDVLDAGGARFLDDVRQDRPVEHIR